MSREIRTRWLLAMTILIAACATTVSSDRTTIRPWGYDPTENPVTIALTIPGNWEVHDDVVTTGDVSAGTFGFVGGGIVGNVFSDQCQWSTTRLDPPLGPTVEDLTAAFSTIWGSNATAPVDVSIDGFEGKYMVLTVPTDADFAHCDSQHFAGWAEAGIPDSYGPSRWYQGPGQILEHWILDVEGVRLLIEASRFPDLSTEGLAEIQGIVDSIQIEAG